MSKIEKDRKKFLKGCFEVDGNGLWDKATGSPNGNRYWFKDRRKQQRDQLPLVAKPDKK